MTFNYPANLPISREKATIIEALQNNQVVIVAGETGSGKTTQLPKMCLEAFPESTGIIGCTQPRRIAATSVASRVADELSDTENRVGYKIRFADSTSKSTKIKFMTDGVLLAETRADRDLKKYGVIIIDEAHERSLNIDFLIGYLKQLLNRRSDLKVIISSATIDTEAFSKHFNTAPVVLVSGRSYPVTTFYKPPEESDDQEAVGSVEQCVMAVGDIFITPPDGDILIFLATERDIRECCKLLEKKIKNIQVLPLFGRLSASDQKRIFQTYQKVKVIVATNVAETSLTVPGIRYVIDSGYARISQYNVRAKTMSLPVTKVSRASCDQRAGRCGRVGPGVCIRLYSEEDYLNRSQFTLPELKRSNLAEVILQMISLKLGNPEDFPFIDPPFKNAIREGYRLLSELGAIDAQMVLTKYGRLMADLPIDPCISRIIIEANSNNCLKEIKIIAAVLAIPDPRIRPAEYENHADAAHERFAHPHSDFMTYLNIWNVFHEEVGASRSWSKLKKFCKQNYLSFQRMREWFDLHEQIDRLLASRDGFIGNREIASYEMIHQSLLSGFLRNLARKNRGKTYQGTHNKELMIFPGSNQFSKAPPWIMAATFIETNNLYALTVAGIDVDWIEPAAKHLCKFSWSSPRWHKKSGSVVADETVSLFGLILRAGSIVNFGARHAKNIPPSRDIFLQSALVEGELNDKYAFLEHNLNKVITWQESESRLRTKNLVADDITLFAFYAERVPAHVYDQRTLNRFLKRTTNKELLFMRDKDILMRQLDEKELIDFPEYIQIRGLKIKLEYNFTPGGIHDGITFRLPIHFAKTISPEIFDWLVPGLLHEKITYLLKSLPKSIRKRLIPINSTVNQLLDDIDFGKGSLLTSIEQSILKQFSFLIKRTDWKSNYPSHLIPKFSLFRDDGKVAINGQDLQSILQESRITEEPGVKPEFNEIDSDILRKWKDTEHRQWAFNGLPSEVTTYTKTGEVSGFLYPSLEPDQAKGIVKVVFLKDPDQAAAVNWKGILFLLRLQFKDQYKGLKKACSTQLSGPSTLFFARLHLPKNELVELVLEFTLKQIIGPLPPGIISEQSYNEMVASTRDTSLFKAGQQIINQILSALRKRLEVGSFIREIFLKGKTKGHFLPPRESCFMEELENVLPHDFLRHPDQTDFSYIDRSLRGLQIRVERFYASPHKDEEKSKHLSPHTHNLKSFIEKESVLNEDALLALREYKLMVNEYKLSLFSPEIKTIRSVSEKKLSKQWQTVLAKN